MNGRLRHHAVGAAGIARMVALTLGLVILPFHKGLLAAVPEADSSASQDEPVKEASEFYDDEGDEEFEEEEIIADPLEQVNRAIFVFNDKLYFYVLKPTARAYRVLPQGVRVSVANFFNNLRTPVRLVNALFQFKLLDAGGELLRFGVNTTVGIGGLFDPAKRYLGLREKDEDFGQTVGNFGIGPGFYLMLPVLGPSSGRDAIGRFVDAYYFDPAVTIPDSTGEVIALWAIDSVNFLSLDKDTYEVIKRESFDPYTFIKNAYAQNRDGNIAK
jgi:phospholipid-binding lipoprotein MlaA